MKVVFANAHPSDNNANDCIKAIRHAIESNDLTGFTNGLSALQLTNPPVVLTPIETLAYALISKGRTEFFQALRASRIAINWSYAHPIRVANDQSATRSYLMNAIIHNNLSLVNELIECGVDVNRVSYGSKKVVSPLAFAYEQQYSAIFLSLAKAKGVLGLSEDSMALKVGVIAQDLQHNKRRCLDFQTVRLSDFDFELVVQSMMAYEGAEGLDLTLDSGMNLKKLRCLIAALESRKIPPNICRLRITWSSSCLPTVTIATEKLLQTVKKLPLKELVLEGFKTTPETIARIAEIVQCDGALLTHLSLVNCRVSDNYLMTLAAAVNRTKAPLKHLRVEGDKSSKQAYFALWHALKTNKALGADIRLTCAYEPTNDAVDCHQAKAQAYNTLLTARKRGTVKLKGALNNKYYQLLYSLQGSGLQTLFHSELGLCGLLYEDNSAVLLQIKPTKKAHKPVLVRLENTNKVLDYVFVESALQTTAITTVLPVAALIDINTNAFQILKDAGLEGLTLHFKGASLINKGRVRARAANLNTPSVTNRGTIFIDDVLDLRDAKTFLNDGSIEVGGTLHLSLATAFVNSKKSRLHGVQSVRIDSPTVKDYGQTVVALEYVINASQALIVAGKTHASGAQLRAREIDIQKTAVLATQSTLHLDGVIIRLNGTITQFSDGPLPAEYSGKKGVLLIQGQKVIVQEPASLCRQNDIIVEGHDVEIGDAVCVRTNQNALLTGVRLVDRSTTTVGLSYGVHAQQEVILQGNKRAILSFLSAQRVLIENACTLSIRSTLEIAAQDVVDIHGAIEQELGALPSGFENATGALVLTTNQATLNTNAFIKWQKNIAIKAQALVLLENSRVETASQLSIETAKLAVDGCLQAQTLHLKSPNFVNLSGSGYCSAENISVRASDIAIACTLRSASKLHLFAEKSLQLGSKIESPTALIVALDIKLSRSNASGDYYFIAATEDAFNRWKNSESNALNTLDFSGCFLLSGTSTVDGKLEVYAQTINFDRSATCEVTKSVALYSMGSVAIAGSLSTKEDLSLHFSGNAAIGITGTISAKTTLIKASKQASVKQSLQIADGDLHIFANTVVIAADLTVVNGSLIIHCPGAVTINQGCTVCAKNVTILTDDACVNRGIINASATTTIKARGLTLNMLAKITADSLVVYADALVLEEQAAIVVSGTSLQNSHAPAFNAAIKESIALKNSTRIIANNGSVAIAVGFYNHPSKESQADASVLKMEHDKDQVNTVFSVDIAGEITANNGRIVVNLRTETIRYYLDWVKNQALHSGNLSQLVIQTKGILRAHDGIQVQADDFYCSGLVESGGAVVAKLNRYFVMGMTSLNSVTEEIGSTIQADTTFISASFVFGLASNITGREMLQIQSLASILLSKLQGHRVQHLSMFDLCHGVQVPSLKHYKKLGAKGLQSAVKNIYQETTALEMAQAMISLMILVNPAFAGLQTAQSLFRLVSFCVRFKSVMSEINTLKERMDNNEAQFSDCIAVIVKGSQMVLQGGAYIYTSYKYNSPQTVIRNLMSEGYASHQAVSSFSLQHLRETLVQAPNTRAMKRWGNDVMQKMCSLDTALTTANSLNLMPHASNTSVYTSGVGYRASGVTATNSNYTGVPYAFLPLGATFAFSNTERYQAGRLHGLRLGFKNHVSSSGSLAMRGFQDSTAHSTIEIADTLHATNSTIENLERLRCGDLYVRAEKRAARVIVADNAQMQVGNIIVDGKGASLQTKKTKQMPAEKQMPASASESPTVVHEKPATKTTAPDRQSNQYARKIDAKDIAALSGGVIELSDAAIAFNNMTQDDGSSIRLSRSTLEGNTLAGGVNLTDIFARLITIADGAEADETKLRQQQCLTLTGYVQINTKEAFLRRRIRANGYAVINTDTLALSGAATVAVGARLVLNTEALDCHSPHVMGKGAVQLTANRGAFNGQWRAHEVELGGALIGGSPESVLAGATGYAGVQPSFFGNKSGKLTLNIPTFSFETSSNVAAGSTTNYGRECAITVYAADITLNQRWSSEHALDLRAVSGSARLKGIQSPGLTVVAKKAIKGVSGFFNVGNNTLLFYSEDGLMDLRNAHFMGRDILLSAQGAVWAQGIRINDGQHYYSRSIKSVPVAPNHVRLESRGNSVYLKAVPYDWQQNGKSVDYHVSIVRGGAGDGYGGVGVCILAQENIEGQGVTVSAIGRNVIAAELGSVNLDALAGCRTVSHGNWFWEKKDSIAEATLTKIVSSAGDNAVQAGGTLLHQGAEFVVSADNQTYMDVCGEICGGSLVMREQKRGGFLNKSKTTTDVSVPTKFRGSVHQKSGSRITSNGLIIDAPNGFATFQAPSGVYLGAKVIHTDSERYQLEFSLRVLGVEVFNSASTSAKEAFRAMLNNDPLVAKLLASFDCKSREDLAASLWNLGIQSYNDLVEFSRFCAAEEGGVQSYLARLGILDGKGRVNPTVSLSMRYSCIREKIAQLDESSIRVGLLVCDASTNSGDRRAWGDVVLGNGLAVGAGRINIHAKAFRQQGVVLPYSKTTDGLTGSLSAPLLTPQALAAGIGCTQSTTQAAHARNQTLTTGQLVLNAEEWTLDGANLMAGRLTLINPLKKLFITTHADKLSVRGGNFYIATDLNVNAASSDADSYTVTQQAGIYIHEHAQGFIAEQARLHGGFIHFKGGNQLSCDRISEDAIYERNNARELRVSASLPFGTRSHTQEAPHTADRPPQQKKPITTGLGVGGEYKRYQGSISSEVAARVEAPRQTPRAVHYRRQLEISKLDVPTELNTIKEANQDINTLLRHFRIQAKVLPEIAKKEQAKVIVALKAIFSFLRDSAATLGAYHPDNEHCFEDSPPSQNPYLQNRRQWPRNTQLTTAIHDYLAAIFQKSDDFTVRALQKEFFSDSALIQGVGNSLRKLCLFVYGCTRTVTLSLSDTIALINDELQGTLIPQERTLGAAWKPTGNIAIAILEGLLTLASKGVKVLHLAAVAEAKNELDLRGLDTFELEALDEALRTALNRDLGLDYFRGLSLHDRGAIVVEILSDLLIPFVIGKLGKASLNYKRFGQFKAPKAFIPTTLVDCEMGAGAANIDAAFIRNIFNYSRSEGTKLSKIEWKKSLYQNSEFIISKGVHCLHPELGEVFFFKYVVDKKATVKFSTGYYGNNVKAHIKHPSLIDGKNAVAAGEITVYLDALGKAVIKEVDFFSGHYLPFGVEARLVRHAFKKAGFPEEFMVRDFQNSRALDCRSIQPKLIAQSDATAIGVGALLKNPLSFFSSKQREQQEPPQKVHSEAVSGSAFIKKTPGLFLSDGRRAPRLQVETGRDTAQRYGYEPEETCGDGNCFYYALARLLARENMQYTAQDLRELAVKHIESNADFYAPQLGGDARLRSFLEEHRRNFTHADETIRLALARELNIDIVVLSDQGNRVVCNRQAEPVATIGLLHVNGNHFESLARAKKPPSNKRLADLIKGHSIDEECAFVSRALLFLP